MKTKKILIILLIIVLIISCGFIFIRILFKEVTRENNYLETDIKMTINNSNKCDTPEDCIVIGSYCPFGCNIVVSKKNASKILSLIKNYNSMCVYECLDYEFIDCKNGTCVII